MSPPPRDPESAPQGEKNPPLSAQMSPPPFEVLFVSLQAQVHHQDCEAEAAHQQVQEVAASPRRSLVAYQTQVPS
jgi:hypothetical protein